MGIKVRRKAGSLICQVCWVTWVFERRTLTGGDGLVPALIVLLVAVSYTGNMFTQDGCLKKKKKMDVF